MKVSTTRFGELEVNNKDIIKFEEGILGFENLKEFFVVDPGDQTLILWLQSTDDGSTAFPIIEPKIFKDDYSISLLPAELNSLKLENLSNASVYTILTIPTDVTQMSANLKAPVIINNDTHKARQIVLQDNKLEVKFEMYAALKKSILNFHSSDDSVRTNVNVTNEPTVVEQTSIETTENTDRSAEA